jgi:hypothetical protein
MAVSIEFDAQHLRRAIKIKHIRADAMLPPEFSTLQFVAF